jgi:hypothetical protein
MRKIAHSWLTYQLVCLVMFIVIYNIFGWSVFDRFVHDDQKIRRIIINRAYYTSQREIWIIMRGFRSTVTKFIFNALPLEK